MLSELLGQPKSCLKQISSPLVLLTAVISFSSSALTWAELDEFDEAELTELEVPIVLTTTRLRQARSEAPGSISIITRQMILNSGARAIPELLRFVPGMSVAKEHGHTYQVSYHGTNFAHSKRMQVLVDGHSIYDAALANVDWELIPVALKDIARIEVARGPNTATHGANAFLGVINIITLKADEGAKAELELSSGSYDINDAYLRYRHEFEQQAFSISLLQQKDDGFDKKPEDQMRNDSKTRRVLNFNWQISPQRGTEIDSQLAISQTKRLSDPDDSLNVQAPPVRDSDNVFLNTDIRHELSQEQSLALKANFRRNNSERHFQACAPSFLLTPEMRAYASAYPQEAQSFLSNPLGFSPSDPAAQALQGAVLIAAQALPGSGTTEVCGVLNEDYREHIANFELSHTWHIGSNFRTLSGFNLRHDQIESQTFFKGEFQRFSYQIFNSSEYKFTPFLTANLGLMYENGEDIKSTFTPRLALNAKLAQNHNLRLVHAKAIRKPALFETQANWSYEAVAITPAGVFPNNRAEYFEQGLGNPNLINEEINSIELGLHSRWPDLGLESDIRVFNDKLEQLISERPILGDFNPTNENEAEQSGVEVELNYQVSTLTQVRFNYAYIDSSATNAAETSFTPNHNISAFASHQLSDSWSLNGAYFFMDNIRNNHYKRADLGLRYQNDTANYHWFAQLQLQHRLDHDHELRSINLYEHNTHALLNIGLNF